MGKLLFLVLAICVLVYIFRPSDTKPRPDISTPSSSETVPDTYSPPPAQARKSSGHWGSGHQAGYDWAQNNSISSEDACEEAGDPSNSPSFAEGCVAFVRGQ